MKVQSVKSQKYIFEEVNASSPLARVPIKKVISLGKDANLEYVFVFLGGTIQREVEIILKSTGAEVKFWGFILGKNKDALDLKMHLTHKRPGTKAKICIKGVLKDQAQLNFGGLIKVEKGAQNVVSSLAVHSLLLGEKPKVRALPSLEIEADDVNVSHKTTFCQIDEEQRFYLMSRGIARNNADQLLVQGFFGLLIDQIQAAGIKNKLGGIMEAVCSMLKE